MVFPVDSHGNRKRQEATPACLELSAKAQDIGGGEAPWPAPWKGSVGKKMGRITGVES